MPKLKQQNIQLLTGNVRSRIRQRRGKLNDLFYVDNLRGWFVERYIKKSVMAFK